MSYTTEHDLEPLPLALPMGQTPAEGALAPAPSSLPATTSTTTVIVVIIVIIIIALVLWWLLSDDKPKKQDRPSVKRVRTPTLARELYQRLEDRGGANPTVMRSLRTIGTQ